MTISLPPGLAALAAWPQFICWFAVPKDDRPGKFDKMPVDWRSGAVVGINDRSAWTDADTALTTHARYDRGHGSGIGFVFTADDPFFFADIDSAAADGQWSPLAQSILARFPGAAVELSHSGRGLHIFGRAAPMVHSKVNPAHKLELYTSGRFAAVTCNGVVGNIDTDHTAALAAYVADYFPPGVHGVAAGGWSTEPVAEWRGPTDDDDLIRRMLASGARSAAQAFGGEGAPTIQQLWEADADALARQWPGEGGKPYDASHADMALANHLAWWTGKDCERMERLMRRSALARGKWDQHRTYLVDTVSKAAAFIRGCLTDRDVAVPLETQQAAAVSAGRTLRDTTREYLGTYDQLDHFADCFFLADPARIYDLRANAVVTKATFDVTRGGHVFIISSDASKTTDSAWDAFTKNRVNVPLIVNDVCFRPEVTPGAIVQVGERTLVNSYVPYAPRTAEGDPAPFLDLLTRMLPDERDRELLLSWFASFAQNQGVKFQWWPVIQGAKGNGKTLLLEVLTYLVGEHYTHLPDAAAMAKGTQFNGWVARKLFIGIEEIKAADRREMIEGMKTLVTNRRMGMETKGVDQFTGDNAANGVITTNHKDGLPLEPDERRYGIWFCAQQSYADIIRDGMGGDYFPNLYDWLRGTGAHAAHGADYGKSIVAHYLQTRPVAAEMDPARGLTRAPRTTATDEAVAASLGRVEQEIVEATEEGRPGFAGGWISSIMLERLLSDMRTSVSRNRRRDLLAALGYVAHPALPNGRTNENVSPDNGKPKLYVRAGHLALNIDTAKGVAEAYSKAQAPAAVAAVAFAKP